MWGPPSPILEAIILQNKSFRDREEAETNLQFKQVIPYILVVHAGNIVITNRGLGATDARYLLSQRTSQQQEKRLHNKFSIGQGGHINELDFTGRWSPIFNGLMREAQEEYTLEDIRDCVPVGLINDNSNDVGKVHLGLVYMLRVGSLAFKVAEQGKHIAQWATKADLEAHYDKMESWSQVVMDHLIRPA